MRHDVELVSLGISDVAHIMPIMESAFDPDFSEPWSEIQLTEAMAIPGMWLIGARVGKEYVGLAACRAVLNEAELLLIAVSPQWRRQLIGESIMHYIFAELQKSMIQKLFLEVRINNKAVHFYNRYGFKTIGNRPNYYSSKSGEVLNALTMCVDIT